MVFLMGVCVAGVDMHLGFIDDIFVTLFRAQVEVRILVHDSLYGACFKFK